MTALTSNPALAPDDAKAADDSFERTDIPGCASGVLPLGRPPRRDPLVTRTLRNHNLWLAVTYVGLLALMARAYA